MAELIVGAILPVLFERLASTPVLDFVKRFKGIPSKLKAWEKKLQMIQDVLLDAEDKQTRVAEDKQTRVAVKTWLDDLQDLAYDVEDLLDEFATQDLERQLMAKDDHAKTSCCSSSKIQKLIIPGMACFTGLKFNRDMASKIEDINSRLDELLEQKKELELVKTSGGIISSSSNYTSQRPAATSLPPVSDIIGRDEERRRILQMVLRDNSGSNRTNFEVISIVGMGGIGKTTLAQAVYNDESLKGMFDVKAWVCISQDFDVLRVSKAILEDITRSSCDLNNPNQVQLKLKDQVDGKKFLLVLDDVWSENYDIWDALIPSFAGGAPCSKIIVTTRNRNVAKTMGSKEPDDLKGLVDDDCWCVFCKHAMFPNLSENVDSIREKVVRRCSGLPLAAKTLGGLLRCKEMHEWEAILSSEIWKPSDKCSILPVLRLSYQYLPSHLKRCFAYCAIFPEDYEFEEEELVLLWMAEGFLPEPKGNNKQMEDVGRETFADLLSRSFFQKLEGGSSKYGMHDLINELAKWVSGDICFRLEETAESEKQPQNLQKVRHSSFVSRFTDGKKRFEVFQETKHLRTFLPLCNDYYNHITRVVVFDMLPKLKKLRVLSLKGYFLVNLPESIGDLRQLRYFNLARTHISSLPESTSRLFNLQTLILRNCRKLSKLPYDMKDLVNLRYLDIKGASSITEMPIGIENLKSLRTLSDFIVGKGSCSTLRDLNNLKLRTCKEFRISKLENTEVLPSEFLVREMVDLKKLVLKWNNEGDGSRDEKLDEKVLNLLQPHKYLEALKIKSYCGNYFPSWLGDSQFTKLKVLEFYDCGNCTSMPSLEKLGFLKELTISNMQKLRFIGPEICIDSLETLRLHLLSECEHWEPTRENDHVQKFTLLRHLSIRNCPKLSGKLPHSLPSLEKLQIDNCKELAVSLLNLRTVYDLNIDGCKKVACSFPVESKPLNSLTLSSVSEVGNCLMQGIQKVDVLKIERFEKLIHLWEQDHVVEKPPQGLHDLISLNKLCIGNCPNLVSIPEVRFLPTLTELAIRDCNALTSLPDGIKHNLESLTIDNCGALQFIARRTIPCSLKRLDVNQCDSLQCVFDDGEDGSTLSPSSSSSFAMTHEEHVEDNAKSLLEYLHIWFCQSVTCLSSSGMLPPALKDLNLYSCPELTTLSSEGQLPKSLQRLRVADCNKLELIAKALHSNSSLESIDIYSCGNLKSIPDGLHNLSRLRWFSISDCPSLDFFPKEGLPNTVSELEIDGCEKLQALPNGMHMLSSLQRLTVSRCPSISSFPKEGFPSNVSELGIGGELKIYKQMMQWLQNLASLKELWITGCQDAVCFPEEETPLMMLPTSLVELTIHNFPKLKYLSSPGIGDLTSLEKLMILNCPNLTSFPTEGLPSSLLFLHIQDCPLLKEGCKRGRGQEWHKIADIPYVKIDGRFIYDLEEE